MPVAIGGIVVREFFRTGASGGTEQLLWDMRSIGGETPEVAMARPYIPLFLTLGRYGVHETGSERRHRSWSSLRSCKGRLPRVRHNFYWSTRAATSSGGVALPISVIGQAPLVPLAPRYIEAP